MQIDGFFAFRSFSVENIPNIPNCNSWRLSSYTATAAEQNDRNT